MNATPTVTVTVTILDKEYCIACPPEERANLEQSARHLDLRMRQIRSRSQGKIIGTERVAVMAALNITHELLHRDNAGNTSRELPQEQVRRLLERVDTALTGSQNPATGS